MPGQFVGVHRVGGDDHRLQPRPAIAAVAHADDNCFGHRRMLQQRCLHLQRIDLVAADLDQEFEAAGDGEGAVGVLPGEIAAAQPAVLERGGVGHGIVEITGRHRGRLQQQLAHAIAEIGIEGDPGPCVAGRAADGVPRRIGIGRVVVGDEDRLGRAVGLPQRDAEAIAEALEQRPRHCRAAAEGEPQGEGIGAFRADQHVVHGRHGAHEADALGDEGFQQPAAGQREGARVVPVDGGCPDFGRVGESQQHAHGEIGGQHVEHDVVGRQLPGGAGAASVGQQLRVGMRHDLGQPGRAR